MNEPLLAELDWTNFIGLIALPIVYFLIKWQAKRDASLVRQGFDQANIDATQKQTRIFLRWCKKQFRLVKEEMAKHEIKDQDRQEEIKSELAIIKKNGNGHS